MHVDPLLLTVIATASAITLIVLTVGLLLLGEDLRTAICLALGRTIIGALLGWIWATRG